MSESGAHGKPLFAFSRLLTFAPHLDLRYTLTTDGQDTSEARRARSRPLKEHLGGGVGTNSKNPRQRPVQAILHLDWTQTQGGLISDYW